VPQLMQNQCLNQLGFVKIIEIIQKPAKVGFLKMILDAVKQIAVDGKGIANWVSQKKADSKSKCCFLLFLPK
jgi:hypothetical protein